MESTPATQARELVRVFRGSPGPTERAASALHMQPAEAHELLRRLAEADYLEITEQDDDGPRWFTTVKGNALAGASFAKPITRDTARRHLDGLLQRVRAYNADHAKPYSVTHVTAFGSYLDPTQNPLGDLDIAIQVVRRVPHDEFTRRRDAITHDSGRYFDSFIRELVYPLRQLILHLKDRKPSINITSEDITTLTDRHSRVYDIGQDPTAEQPHEDATVEPLS
ncbi:hypothetical protein ACFV4N_22785 [Actinosynnema sp. NPDC059797]